MNGPYFWGGMIVASGLLLGVFVSRSTLEELSLRWLHVRNEEIRRWTNDPDVRRPDAWRRTPWYVRLHQWLERNGW